MKHLFLVLSLFLGGQGLFSQATTVSTFHCISLYWSPLGGDATKSVQVQYRVSGQIQWYDGLDMKYNPIAGVGINPATNLRYDKADYRGSIVDLIPNTQYDIKLTLEGTALVENIQASTWSENFPIGTVLTPGNLTSRYNVTTSGTANAYLLIDGTGNNITSSSSSKACIRLQNVEYVIIRGYTLNGGRYGILLENCKHIIIEDCDISNWGDESDHNTSGNIFGHNTRAAIKANAENDAVNIIIQRNKIHHPKWDSNNWSETVNGTNHPQGPTGVSFWNCLVGNNVIRYNEFWTDSEHYFNDVLGYGSNHSYSGFPGPDSDIYNNYIANSWDDGIEVEGCNTNVRVWANYIEHIYLPIGNAATSIGPLYIWRNISGESYSPPGSQYDQYAAFIKMGYAGGLEWMTGHMYIFNNTVLQPNGSGAGGLGTRSTSTRHIRHCISRNNILHTNSDADYSISNRAENIDNDYDYDLLNSLYPVGHEINGFFGAPIYQALTFDFATKTGDFRLNSSSLGFDEGLIIPNFSSTYIGSGPDAGAHENGTSPMVFGVLANYSPPPLPLPIFLLSFNLKEENEKHILSWQTSSEIDASHFEIFYSENNRNWTKLGVVLAKGAENQLQNYRFENSDISTHNYYKLKMVDYDNSYTFSKILNLKGALISPSIIPNPAKESIVITNLPQDSFIEIYNLIGVLVKTIRHYNGSIIDISKLTIGTYFVKTNDDLRLKFIKE